MIDIAFCVNDAYVPYICVTIKSILVNNQGCEIHFHILTDSFSPKGKTLLDEVCLSSPGIRYDFYIVDDAKITGISTDFWSKYAWYRILLPLLLPTTVEKVLYLDADTLVLGRIQELFSIDLQGKAIAGCLDPISFLDSTYQRCGYSKELQYLCSGVLLINLAFWRDNNLTEAIRMIAYEQGTSLNFADQDPINIACKNRKVLLPLRYGIQGSFFTDSCFFQKEFANQLRDCITNPVIIHYAGQTPWKKEWANHPFQKEWEYYNNYLKHPAKRYYLTRGWLFIRMMLWKMMNLSEGKKRIFSRSDFLNKLDELDK